MRPILVLVALMIAGCATPIEAARDPPPAHEVVAFQAPLEVPMMSAGVYYSSLTLDQAQKALTAPISPTADTYLATTQTLTTTAAPLFASDLAAGARISTVVQALRISNRSSANTVCVWYPLFATSCAATCTATAETCTGISTDGDPIQPGSVLTVPITGEACACGIASAATTLTTATRVVRDREK